jgi:ATP-dependent RNA helicase RhlB
MKFESLNLPDNILQGLSDAAFERCTPIQELSLPTSIEGKDLIAQSQTGSGKTAVFLITIFKRLMDGGEPQPGRKPRALIVVPTRELATQVSRDSELLGKHLNLTTLAIYGGVEYDKQIKTLKAGVDIVTATPGRLIDLYKSKNLSLDSIDIFVVDEADRMFDMGFAPDITYIASHLPKKKPRQTMLFSATIDSNVRRLASMHMQPDPIILEIEPEQVTVNTIDQKLIYVSNEEKLSVLLTLLTRPDTTRTIIFTNMKRTAEMLGFKLNGNGFSAEVLTGDVSQAKRERIMGAMKSGKLKILVATDVAARGLHIEDISHVINYDLPEDAASYVHRIGRTARAGKSGKAYSLGCESHVFNLPEIEKFIEHKIESEWIETEDMVEDKAGPYRSRPRSPRPGSGPSRSGGSSRYSSAKPAGRRPPPKPRRAPAAQKAAPSTPAPSAPKAAPAPASASSPSSSSSPSPSNEAKEISARTGEQRPPSSSESTGGERPQRPRRRRRRSSSSRPRTEKTEGSASTKPRTEAKGPADSSADRPKRPAASRPRSRGGAKSGSARTGGRPQPARKKSAHKADTTQDKRLSIYKSKYDKSSAAPASAKPEKKAAAEPKKKESILKRVFKSFLKK